MNPFRADGDHELNISSILIPREKDLCARIYNDGDSGLLPYFDAARHIPRILPRMGNFEVSDFFLLLLKVGEEYAADYACLNCRIAQIGNSRKIPLTSFNIAHR